MPVHKLPLIMVSNVQKNASLIHTQIWKKISPRFAPVDKSWLHHCYWNSYEMHKGAMPPPPPH